MSRPSVGQVRFMALLPQFEFNCPACGTRRRISVLQREALLTCQTCGVQFPGPDFHTGVFDPGPVPRERTYECFCTACGSGFTAAERDVRRDVCCGECGQQFHQPPPAWDHWRRAVARVLTRADLHRSLHHLMTSTDRTFWPDEMLNERERRRFEFYCGACGRLQPARVWDIGCQRRCLICRELLIIPAPGAWRGLRRQVRITTRSPVRPDSRRSLFCPQCGHAISDSDPTRRHKSFCPSCELWF